MRIRLNKDIDPIQLLRETYSEPKYKLELKIRPPKQRSHLLDDVDVEITKPEGWKIRFGFKLNPWHEAVIAWVCPTCGCEIYGQWKEFSFSIDADRVSNAQERLAKKEVNKIRKVSVCPLCGGKLSRDKGYYIEGNTGFCGELFGIAAFSGDKYSEAENDEAGNNEPVMSNDGRPCSRFFQKAGNIDAYFEELKTQREPAELNSANESLGDKISVWSDTPFSSLSNEASEAIKSDPVKLKEHVLNLIKLEMNAYSLSKRLVVLYVQQQNMQRAICYSKYAPSYERKQKIEELKNCIAECEKQLKEYAEGNIGVELPVKPTEPIYATPGLFNKKKVLAENDALKAKYLNDLKTYEDQMAAYEKKKGQLIAKAQEASAAYGGELERLQQDSSVSESASGTAIGGKAIIDNEIAEAEQLLKGICECRNRIYNYDIVFSKYRDIVALSSFYEYLMAGRCSTLEGADGAYNLYENQIRADMIIGQLSTVIEKLDEIKDSQYVIYSELQKVNKNLDRLNQTMDKALGAIQNIAQDVEHIAENTDVIAHNTAVTAYYSKVNAELTNALGYMVAFK